MMEENIIKIRIDGEYFSTAGEMVNFVGARLKAALEFWPERLEKYGRQRIVNLERFIPGKAVIYKVFYCRDSVACE